MFVIFLLHQAGDWLEFGKQRNKPCYVICQIIYYIQGQDSCFVLFVFNIKYSKLQEWLNIKP